MLRHTKRLKSLIKVFCNMRFFCHVCNRSLLIGSLSTHVLRRGRQPEEDISRARTVVSLRFLYQASLMEKRYLAMQMGSCEDKLKGKTAHFRLPSASQKRACLSSLIILFLLDRLHFVVKKLQTKIQKILTVFS